MLDGAAAALPTTAGSRDTRHYGRPKGNRSKSCGVEIIMAPGKDYAICGGAAGRERLRMLSRVMHASTTSLFDRFGINAGKRMRKEFTTWSSDCSTSEPRTRALALASTLFMLGSCSRISRTHAALSQ